MSFSFNVIIIHCITSYNVATQTLPTPVLLSRVFVSVSEVALTLSYTSESNMPRVCCMAFLQSRAYAYSPAYAHADTSCLPAHGAARMGFDLSS